MTQQQYVLAGLILTFLTTLLSWLQSMRNGEKIKEVHMTVNGHIMAMAERVAQLTKALTDAGTEIPPKPGEKP